MLLDHGFASRDECVGRGSHGGRRVYTDVGTRKQAVIAQTPRDPVPERALQVAADVVGDNNNNQVSGRCERVLHRSFGRRSVVVDVFFSSFFSLGARAAQA